MSEKQRKSVTLDPEVSAYLSQEGRNASQTVNKLVKMEMGKDVVDKTLLKYRMQSEKDQYKSAAQKARGHLERYNQLKRQLEKTKSREDELMQDVREKLANVPLQPDNPAVEKQAKRVNMAPKELIKEVQDDAN